MTSRTEALAQHLREEIASGRISAGQKLPSEAQLLSEHGVSRTVVREALGRLAAEGLIHTVRGSGSYALTVPTEPHTTATAIPSNHAERLELLEYRIAMETQTAALAAQHRSQQQLQEMTQTLEKFSCAEGPGAAVALDFQFHQLIASASTNGYLLRALEQVGPAMITMPRGRISGHTESRHDAHKEHRQILNAIAAGSPQDAAAAMRTHLAASRSRLMVDADPDT